MSELKAIDIVFAKWCPHCIPTTVFPLKRAAMIIGIPIWLWDIDDARSIKYADNLVKKYGDWSPDYLIPQVFLEFADGKIKHVLTGDSRSVEHTKKKVMALFKKLVAGKAFIY